MDDYLQKAAVLKQSLDGAKGMIRAERFASLAAEGKLLSMSVWEDEQSVTAWRNQAAHRAAQRHGRRHDFADYTITVLSPIRTYTMTGRAQAPVDSNTYWGV